ncbi:MAG: NAD(P)H-hydrate dehydratase [Pseudomonadota bacterium]
MIHFYSIAKIRLIEQAAAKELAGLSLMQRAGRAASVAALEILTRSSAPPAVLILVGPGDNGGDALLVAAELTAGGIAVTLISWADSGTLSADAAQALSVAQSYGLEVLKLDSIDDLVRAIQKVHWTLVIDGLFGIGLSRPIVGVMPALIDAVNHLGCPILSLDVPSGLNADTGQIVGPQGIAIRATYTMTFIGTKPGLHTGQGRDHAGLVEVASLGIQAGQFVEPDGWLNSPEIFAGFLMPRLHDSHKGSYGDVTIVGGASGMTGAPLLAARAAAYCGAGRVIIGFIGQAPMYDSSHPELMLRQAQDCVPMSGSMVLGPGMGSSSDAKEALVKVLRTALPMVIDADALNLISGDAFLQTLLVQRSNPCVMTPHPLEAARLLGVSIKSIQADRLASAKALNKKFNATIILKGSGTVIADMANGLVINPTGNPALATAGSGDILAGVCGAFLAQGCGAWQAALAAVWLHGRAADNLIKQGVGPIGVTASELIPSIRQALNAVIVSGV